MNNTISELVFILDRSGSMRGLESDTVGGFNAMIEKQKQVEGRCYITTVLVDNDSQTIHDRVDLREIRPMTLEDFSVRGCTALLDALGGTIRHIAHIHKYARPEDVPGHTTFVIMTDGMENASRRFGSDEVKRLIKHEKEVYGWEFLFLAANIAAVETAAHYGIGADRAVRYSASPRGTQVAYDTVAETVCAQRRDKPIDAGWSRRIKEENQNS